MWTSHLLLAWRMLRRSPVFSALNVAGLTIGMTCCLLIGLYVQHELTYDTHHEDADRIVRVVQRTDDGGGMATGGDGMRMALEEVSGVEAIARMVAREEDLSVTDPSTGRAQAVKESDFYYVSPSFVSMFTVPVLHGDPKAALARPRTAVLTELRAHRLFGTSNPMGRTLTMDGDTDLEVAAVVADPPANSHLQYGVLTGMSTYFVNGGYPADYQSSSFWWPLGATYARLAPQADRAEVEAQFREIVQSRRRPEVAAQYTPVLQPLSRVHLHSATLTGNPSPPSTPGRVGLFAAIAGFVLLIAGVNFVNLSTARATDRAQEVGVRKSLGAGGSQLMRQFLGESLLLSLASVGVALGLASLLLPAFEALLDVRLAYGVWGNPVLAAGAAGVVALTGLGAGSYPAFILARFDPTRALRGAFRGGRSRDARLRQSLVVGQFALSAGLIVATLVAFQQVQYMRSADLGFSSDQVVVLDDPAELSTLIPRLEQRTAVRNVTVGSVRPGMGDDRIQGMRYALPGSGVSTEPGDRLSMQSVSNGFFEMFEIDVLAGRGFGAEFPGDRGTVQPRDDVHFTWWWTDRGVVLNRAAVENFGWTPQEALGRSIRLYSQEGERVYTDLRGTVVGVVENYHTSSLRRAIRPMAYVTSKAPYGEDGGLAWTEANHLFVEVAPGDAGTVLETIRETWAQVVPTRPLRAGFLNERIDAMYRAEQRASRVLGVFASLAILVAGFGLFGLALHTVRQRRKEIGVRKALGASAASIVTLLTTHFLKLAALAVALGAPVAYLAVQEWLDGFAYHVSVGPGTFLVAAGLALALAALPVGLHTLWAARLDPATVLNEE